MQTNYQGRRSWSAVAEKPTSFSSGVVERLTDLDSSQEEANTRLLLHAAHATRSKFVAVIIVSEDTDVLVLCLAFKSFIPSSMFIKCSSQTRVKYLDVPRIVERTEANTCKSLPGFQTSYRKRNISLVLLNQLLRITCASRSYSSSQQV